jgi:serine/threonine protein kinase HipA of HipAB toxin-antitoxin module
MTTKQDQDPTEVVQGSWKTTKEKRKRKTLPEGAKVEKNSKKPQLHIQKEKSGKTRDPRKQNSMGTHKSKNLQAPKIQCKVQVGNSKTQNPKQRGISKTQKPKQKGE